MTEALSYKLVKFVVNLEGLVEVYCDNKSVVKNSSVPVSVLNKIHNAICYNRVIESQASGTFMVGWISGKYNLVDLSTKNTMTGNMRHGMA